MDYVVTIDRYVKSSCFCLGSPLPNYQTSRGDGVNTLASGPNIGFCLPLALVMNSLESGGVERLSTRRLELFFYLDDLHDILQSILDDISSRGTVVARFIV